MREKIARMLRHKTLFAVMTVALMLVGGVGVIGEVVSAEGQTYNKLLCDSEVEDVLKEQAGCNLGENDRIENAGLTVINLIIGIVVVLAVISIVVGGIQLSASAGNPGQTAKGRQAIIYGVIAIVIALLAFAIVNFVLGSLFT